MLSACKPQFANTLPAGFSVDRTFGQLYDDGGTKKVSHYNIVSLPVPAVLTVSDGTIEYIPGTSDKADGLGNCLLLRPRTYPISENDFSALQDLPGPATIVIAYCNLDDATVKTAVQALYAIALPAELPADHAAAAAHFMAGDEGFKTVDVRSDNQNPIASSPLGSVIGGKLYLAAFTEDDFGSRRYVNPLPYLAAVIPPATLDSVPPVLDEVVIETSESGDFAVDGVLHPIVADAIADPLPRHRMRIAVRATDKMTAAGQDVVPYRIAAAITSDTPTPLMRVRTTALMNRFTRINATSIAAATYGTQGPVTSVPGVGVYWIFPFWNPAWPPAAAGDDGVNALDVTNHTIELNRIENDEEVFPGGDYQLALSVGDIPSSSPVRTIRFKVKEGVRMRIVRDHNDDHVIDGSDHTIDAVYIARWDSAYTSPPLAVVNNPDPHNFVDRDPSRFYVRIADAAANTNPAAIDVIHAKIGTVDEQMHGNDDMTDIVLRETTPNSGDFASRSQILTTNKLFVFFSPPCSEDNIFCDDDEFFAHEGATGGARIKDDLPGDRTHRADIDNVVRVTYRPTGATEDHAINVPVCRRNPDERRQIHVRFVVYYEPFLNNGLDHDPSTNDIGNGDVDANNNPQFTPANQVLGAASEEYLDISKQGTLVLPGSDPRVQSTWGPVVDDIYIQRELDRANISWAPACTKFVKDGPTRLMFAPRDAAGNDILIDGSTTLQDVDLIYLQLRDTMTPDTLTAIYVGNMPGALGWGFNPSYMSRDLAFTTVAASEQFAMRTLAHEFGHLITNTGDSHPGLQYMYPENAAAGDTPVTENRRISESAKIDAQTNRPLGDFQHRGNSARKNLQ